jgi:hypothetical protein
VAAVNVTDRYAPAVAAAPDARVRLLVRILDGGKPIAAKVNVTSPADAALKLEGTSSDESADLNNLLTFPLPRGQTFHLQIEHGKKAIERDVKTTDGKEAEQIVTLVLTP